MNPAAYREMAETESTHWWFVGRRAILARLIEQLHLPPDARVLEIGCGTGGNLEMLGSFGRLSAMEMDGGAREIASNKANGRYDVRGGKCPDNIPFATERFDLVCLFDVLEHIEEDIATLAAVRNLLAPGGRVLLTVPAYQWLWSSHDEFLHHKRRYSARSLFDTADAAGLRTVRSSYFNSLLFPVIACLRLQSRWLGRTASHDGRVPKAAVNHVLTRVFSSERRVVDRFNLAFGVSLLAILEDAKPHEA